MEIRTATLEDTDSIIQLGNSADEFQVNKETPTFWPKEILINCIKDNNVPILVAEENKQIFGFIIANYNPSFKKAIIENILVNPNHRGKELGRLLLKNLLNTLIKLDCKYVCALTQINNDLAVEFFLKNEFSKGIDCVWLDKVLDDSFQK
jgi:N-acetylglutamate synthase-like GNAT family acetyltransferase